MKGTTSFYLLTDTHLVSKQNWVDAPPINRRERGDQIALKASPEILDAFLAKIIADQDTDTVIFIGDNVNSGDKASHEDFRARLDRLKAAGKKVYVTTATHDYCSPNGEDECFQHDAVRYTETGTEPTAFFLRKDLAAFYNDYGPKQALSVDPESGSYTVQLGDGVRMILIIDNGNGRSHCGLFEEGMQWLADQIKDAKATGNFVMLAVHHPVIAPWEVFRHMVEYELYGGYRELSELMCSEGVRVVFTGHTHVQNIRKYTDDAGRWFVDVSTTAAVSAKGQMRHVTVDADTGICDIQSVGLETLPGVDTGGKSAYEYLYGLNFAGRVERFFPLIKTDFDRFLEETDGVLPAEKLRAHKTLAKLGLRTAAGFKLSLAAKLGKVWRTLTPQQKKAAKQIKLFDVIFTVCRHIYPGNAPYPPGTLEYTVLHALLQRLDRLVEKHKIEKVQKLIPPGSSIAEIGEDFLYNNRTGDDNAIRLQLNATLGKEGDSVS